MLEGGESLRQTGASNGMEIPTRLMWRPNLVDAGFWKLRMYELGLNLQRGAVRDFLSDAVCSVACLEWNLRIEERDCFPTAMGQQSLPLEIFSAKEDKETV